MISIKFFNQGCCLVGFSIHGHSGDASKGRDIICAAVSSAAYMAVNIITDILHVNASVDIHQDGDMLLLIQEKDQPTCKDILEGLKIHLQDLKSQYPHNILLNFTEV